MSVCNLLFLLLNPVVILVISLPSGSFVCLSNIQCIVCGWWFSDLVRHFTFSDDDIDAILDDDDVSSEVVFRIGILFSWIGGKKVSDNVSARSNRIESNNRVSQIPRGRAPKSSSSWCCFCDDDDKWFFDDDDDWWWQIMPDDVVITSHPDTPCHSQQHHPHPFIAACFCATYCIVPLPTPSRGWIILDLQTSGRCPSSSSWSFSCCKIIPRPFLPFTSLQERQQEQLRRLLLTCRSWTSSAATRMMANCLNLSIPWITSPPRAIRLTVTRERPFHCERRPCKKWPMRSSMWRANLSNPKRYCRNTRTFYWNLWTICKRYWCVTMYMYCTSGVAWLGFSFFGYCWYMIYDIWIWSSKEINYTVRVVLLYFPSHIPSFFFIIIIIVS